jgi:hypothetical protein
MTVSQAQLDELKTMEAGAREYGGSDLSGLGSIPEVIAWVISDCRAAGDDEVSSAELLIRHSNMSPDEVRSAERVLRRLGFIAVAEMMRQIAGKRRHGLRPLDTGQ